MSKLADRIRRAGRIEPAPIGFAASSNRRAAPSMLCIVRLAGNETGKVEEAARRGADALIIDGLDAGKAKDAAGKAGDLPLGVALRNAPRNAVAALREAGAGFVVLDAESAMAEALLEEKIGFVLAVDGKPADTTLRLLADLNLDALLVPPVAGPLKLADLLELRRISALARTPLLAPVRADADASLLQALRDSGVAGIVVDPGAIGKLPDLRERIAALPPRGKKREEGAQPLIPAGVGAHGHDEDDDED